MNVILFYNSGQEADGWRCSQYALSEKLSIVLLPVKPNEGFVTLVLCTPTVTPGVFTLVLRTTLIEIRVKYLRR